MGKTEPFSKRNKKYCPSYTMRKQGRKVGLLQKEFSKTKYPSIYQVTKMAFRRAFSKRIFSVYI